LDSSSEVKLNDIADEISKSLKELATEIIAKDEVIVIQVNSEKLLEAAKRLKEMGFDHVKSVTATDFPQDNLFEITYHASSLGDLDLAKVIVALKTKIPSDDPRLPSLVDIWPSSKYLEREEFEMLGITFERHPELEKLLLPYDYEGPPPLRKEFKVKTEGIQA